MRLSRHLALILLTLGMLAVRVPALDWKATTVSVTTAPFQSTIDAVFEFKNSGSQPVTINDVATNCDCLEAAADRKVYAPGETGLIRTRFTVGDRTGQYVRIITVLTDEPADPVRLSLQIEVPDLVTLTPRSVSWQLREAPTEKSVELLAAQGLQITFVKIQPTNEAFAARLEIVEPGRHYRLHLKPRGTAQPASAAIRIYGQDKSGRDVVVSAYCNIQ